MPGTQRSHVPTYETTLAVTIERGRLISGRGSCKWDIDAAGLYSYDWLDRLFGFLDAPSADRILPESQRLTVGDVIPVGRGGGFPVRAIEPFRALVLGGETDGFQMDWQFGLYPVNERADAARIAQPRAGSEDPVGSTALHVCPRTRRVYHDAQDAARSQAPRGNCRRAGCSFQCMQPEVKGTRS